MGAVKWWFQKFTANKKGPDGKTIVHTDYSLTLGNYTTPGTARYKLTQAPGDDSNVMKVSFDVSDTKTGLMEEANLRTLLFYGLMSAGHIPNQQEVLNEILEAMPE